MRLRTVAQSTAGSSDKFPTQPLLRRRDRLLRAPIVGELETGTAAISTCCCLLSTNRPSTRPNADMPPPPEAQPEGTSAHDLASRPLHADGRLVFLMLRRCPHSPSWLVPPYRGGLPASLRPSPCSSALPSQHPCLPQDAKLAQLVACPLSRCVRAHLPRCIER